MDFKFLSILLWYLLGLESEAPVLCVFNHTSYEGFPGRGLMLRTLVTDKQSYFF